MRNIGNIENCKVCLDLEPATVNTLKPKQKPCVYFHINERWKPDKVDVLFIAESPPCNGNQRLFYNPEVAEKRTNLRKEILSRLDLNTLEDFKKGDFFLIDTIKCRICKPIKRKMLYEIAKTCSQRFLREEIKQLKPNTIFVLGNTARYTLGRFPEFKELKNHKVTSGFKGELSGYHVILCPYPGGQTRKHEDKIDQAFGRLCTKERVE